MSFQAWTVERGKALLLGTYPDAGMCTRVLRNASEGGAIVQGGEIVRTPKGTKDTVASLIAQAAREHHRTHPETPVAVVETPAPAVELPAVVVPEEVPAPVAEEIDLGAELAGVEEDARPLATVAGSPCAVEGCAKPAERDGLCVKHYARQTERTRAMDRSQRDAEEIAASLAPAPAPVPAVERPAMVAAPAPTPTLSDEAPMVPSKTCAVRGCTSAPAGVRADTKPWIAPFCSGHRLRAYEAVRAQRATEDTVGAYLSAGPHKAGTKAGTKSTARMKPPTPRAASPAPIASETAVELSADTIQVTITLPSDVARAHRCALSVGGVAQLEQLVAAVLAVRP